MTVALVTGGATGIRLATAVRLAEHGAAVVVADIAEAAGQEAAGQEAAAAIRARGREGSFVRLDVRDGASVAAAVAHAVSAYGRLDWAVNAAGIAEAGCPLGRISGRGLSSWTCSRPTPLASSAACGPSWPRCWLRAAAASSTWPRWPACAARNTSGADEWLYSSRKWCSASQT